MDLNTSLAVHASRLKPIRNRAAITAALLLASGIMGASGVARADGGMHTFRIEGGVGIPVTTPQTSRFDLGGGGALGYELRPIPWLGIEARFSAYVLTASAANPGADAYGTYYAPALGLRLHPLAGLGVGDLWVGAVGAVVFTGDLVRPGLEVGIGYEFNVAWWLRMGPFVRYQHVFQTEPGSDAGFVTLGLSVAFGGDQPLADRDGDGILDSDDACPNEPEDLDSFQDGDGCPDTDNDADGVPDAQDACPNDPEDRDSFEDSDGCPDPDNDHDRILDGADACPNVAEDPDGFEDEDGCPDLDNDRDLILDASDACSNEFETMNGIDDADGCPDCAPPPPPRVRTETEVQLDQLGERIQFAVNTVRVLPESRASLREVIRLLRQHPEIIRVTVESHASPEGESDDNMELSQRRAQAIVESLVRGRIARTRLVTHALGEQSPEVAGTSEEELAANRRVVFIVEHRLPVEL